VRKKSSRQPKKAPTPKLTSNKEPAVKPPRPRPKPKKVSNASLDGESAQVAPQDDNATLQDAAEILASLKHTPNPEPQGDDLEINDSGINDECVSDNKGTHDEEEEVNELDDSSDDRLEEHGEWLRASADFHFIASSLLNTMQIFLFQ